MSMPEPRDQHRWLQTLVGEWTWESEPVPGHDHPLASGTETARAIGGFWIELASEGGYGTNRMTLGYNPDTARFIGTWVGGTMPHLWVYDGAVEADGRTLVLAATGPAMDRDGVADYRDVVELVGPDERTLKASYVDKNGAWVHFMTTRYRRVGTAV